jgi:hypothetical protein
VAVVQYSDSQFGESPALVTLEHSIPTFKLFVGRPFSRVSCMKPATPTALTLSMPTDLRVVQATCCIAKPLGARVFPRMDGAKEHQRTSTALAGLLLCWAGH